ncbi:hypothetical protein BGW42_004938 [Actinomortierella wolfii]|nr:hypothetical protein BGW42_004938 [Actinomortierella wolfii]
MATTNIKAIVVGAGISGITVALGLELAGIDYIVLEQASEKELKQARGGATQLGPSAIHFLVQLGLEDELIRIAKPLSGITMNAEDMSFIGRIDYTSFRERYGYHSLVVPLAQLRSLLLRQVPAKRIRYGHKVLGFMELPTVAGASLASSSSTGADDHEQRQPHVLVRCSDGSTVEGDILIGADGAFSTVRHQMYWKLDEKKVLCKEDQVPMRTDLHWISGITKPLNPGQYPALVEDMTEVQMVHLAEKPYSVWYMPLVGNRIAWDITRDVEPTEIRQGEASKAYTWRHDEIEDLWEAVKEVGCPLGGHMKDLIENTSIDEVGTLMIEDRYYETWYSGRVGFNMPVSDVMVDGVTLVNLLYRLESNTTESLSSVFKAYVEKRSGQVRSSVEQCTQTRQVFMGKGRAAQLKRTMILHYMPDKVRMALNDKRFHDRPQWTFIPGVPDQGTTRPLTEPDLAHSRQLARRKRATQSSGSSKQGDLVGNETTSLKEGTRKLEISTKFTSNRADDAGSDRRRDSRSSVILGSSPPSSPSPTGRMSFSFLRRQSTILPQPPSQSASSAGEGGVATTMEADSTSAWAEQLRRPSLHTRTTSNASTSSSTTRVASSSSSLPTNSISGSSSSPTPTTGISRQFSSMIPTWSTVSSPMSFSFMTGNTTPSRKSSSMANPGSQKQQQQQPEGSQSLSTSQAPLSSPTPSTPQDLENPWSDDQPVHSAADEVSSVHSDNTVTNSNGDGIENQQRANLENPASQQSQPSPTPSPSMRLIGANRSKRSSLLQPESFSFTQPTPTGDIKDTDDLILLTTQAERYYDIDAQVALAGLFDLGGTLPRSDSWAIYWYRKAASRGHVASQFQLAQLYLVANSSNSTDTTTTSSDEENSEQEVVAKSDAEAARWCLEAALHGDAQAQNRLGVMYEYGQGVDKSDAEAIAWYRQAAEQDIGDAQNSLGLMYQHGRGGLDQNDKEAVAWYRRAAELGNVYAQCNLGFMYRNGLGVEQSDTEAVAWYRKSAEQGHDEAQNNLGWMYQNGYGVEMSDSTALVWYGKAADQGHSYAQFSLGWMYANARGVAKDEVLAVMWYRRAANQDHVDAQNSLGWMIQNGRGVEQSDEEAVYWYRKAADQGNANAMSNLGWMYENGRGIEQSDTEAVYWYRKAADLGNMWAKNNVGVMYQNGRGVEQSDEEAVKWYRLAADQGHPGAQFNLAVMYENGQGVEKDVVESAVWYQKSADQGNASAQNNLGVKYQNGVGVEKDDVKAAELYRKSAEQGHKNAQFNLGSLYKSGRGVEKSDTEAAKWYRKAAEQGNVDAQSNLGWMYESGRGVEKSDTEAVKWYLAAAEQGNAYGQFNLGNMYYDGRGVEQDDKEAVHWYRMAAEQGDSFAQNNLAWMYDLGRGVEQDDAKAMEWCIKSAKQGCKEAQCGLGISYAIGLEVEQDDEKAIDWFRKAVEQDDPDAKLHIKSIESRRQQPKDEALEGFAWYHHASEKGDAAASYNLGMLYEKGIGVEKDIARAAECFGKAFEQGHTSGKERQQYLLNKIKK